MGKHGKFGTSRSNHLGAIGIGLPKLDENGILAPILITATPNWAIKLLIKDWHGRYIVYKDNVGSAVGFSLTYYALRGPKVAKMNERRPILIDFVQCLTLLAPIGESKVSYSTVVFSTLYVEINQSQYMDF